jgi:hypothetical protein
MDTHERAVVDGGKDIEEGGGKDILHTLWDFGGLTMNYALFPCEYRAKLFLYGKEI